MLFKACPKCHGDMFVGGDHYGTYLQCFQCGMTLEATGVADAKLRSAGMKADRQVA